MNFTGDLNNINRKYSGILIDPPWPYYGDPNKPQAAGKHYNLMTEQEIYELPIKKLCSQETIVFVWTTSSKLEITIDAINTWELYFRGVAFVRPAKLNNELC